VENHDDALPIIERAKCSRDFISVEDYPKWVPLNRFVTRFKGDESDPIPTPEAISADIYQDAVEPGREGCRIVQSFPTAPRAQERLLGSVFSLVLVAQQHAGEAVAPIQILASDRQKLPGLVACFRPSASCVHQPTNSNHGVHAAIPDDSPMPTVLLATTLGALRNPSSLLR
jgi:hypothetical protein